MTTDLLIAVLTPVLVCVVAAVVLSAVIRVVGGRLLGDPAEVAGLSRITLVGVTAVGVLVGLGRLVDREATDTGLRASLAGIITALPGLTTSFVLLIAALLIAAVLRATVTRVVGVVRPSLARTLGATVYWAIVGLVSLIAAEQAGIDVAVIRQLLLIAFAGLVLACAIGAGLALRPLLGSVIAGRHVESTMAIGDRVRIGEVSGEVEGIGPVSIRLRTMDGTLVDVPHEHVIAQGSAIG